MVTYKDNSPVQRFRPWWRWILTGLNLFALVLSIILSWHYLAGGSMAGCGGGSPCDQVLSSRWSMVAGIIPVSGLAVGAYLTLLVAGLFIGPDTEWPVRRLVWSVMIVLGGSVAGSAVWFTILQKWFIGEFCLYCMTTHITGFLLATLVIWRAFKESDIRPFRVSGLALIGLVLAGILAACQMSFTPSAVSNDGGSQVNIPEVDYHNAPIVGAPDAPYVVTLLFDYQCSHCQKIHFMLQEAVRQYDGKLAFVLCPTPLNNECNPYIPGNTDAFKNSCELAKIGLAVWNARREAFPAFENWMFTFESGNGWYPRSLEATRQKAIDLVGQEPFDNSLKDPWVEQYMQTCIRMYGQTLQNNQGGIPKMIYGSAWTIPEPYNADDLITLLQESLAVPKP